MIQDINWINSVDMAGFTFFGNMQSGFLTGIARLFSFDGLIFYLIGIAILVSLCLFRKSRKIGVAMVIAALIGALLCNGLIKQLIQRPRPYVELYENAAFMKWYIGAGMLTDSSFSFPSGHTTAITALMTVLFICHVRSARKAARAISWIFPVVAMISGSSRVYLMIHYTTDIMAGFVIGMIAGICGYLIVRKLRDVKLFKQLL